MIVGWRCAVCGTTVDVSAPHPFRCPRSTARDRHHVLHPLDIGRQPDRVDDANPFIAYGPRLAWWAFARAHGMTAPACAALTHEVAAGFVVTPLERSDRLSTDVGGDVWVKDDTANVGGSHKGRHLVTILLHLRAAEVLGLVDGPRRPLAIASCGNAGIAAATLAARVEWPLDVFVPAWADDGVVARMEQLGATVTRCPRKATDPAGDPAVLRFREAVDAGAVPFSVQGPENALCLDGGRTLGWELADAGVILDRVVVQVGGGALATSVGWGVGPHVRLDAVQVEGCAPLQRAWSRAAGVSSDALGRCWAELMTPWDDPRSAADGILDDETYDWLGVFDVLRRSGGAPVVVSESSIGTANELARAAGYAVSPTGSVGLAALLDGLGDAAGAPTSAVLFTGRDQVDPGADAVPGSVPA
jgi:threonine synthase